MNTCTVEQACLPEVHGDYQEVEDSPITLNNWMTNLDLICEERYAIGL